MKVLSALVGGLVLDVLLFGTGALVVPILTFGTIRIERGSVRSRPCPVFVASCVGLLFWLALAALVFRRLPGS